MPRNWHDYDHIFIKETQKYIGVHVKVWTDANGPLKEGWIVHHINGNKHDNRIENLLAMPLEEHISLHHRLRAERECGNPDYRKCHYCKKYDDPENMRSHHCGGFFHRSCKTKYQVANISNKRAKRRAEREKSLCAE